MRVANKGDRSVYCRSDAELKEDIRVQRREITKYKRRRLKMPDDLGVDQVSPLRDRRSGRVASKLHRRDQKVIDHMTEVIDISAVLVNQP